jgi:acylphosphatase
MKRIGATVEGRVQGVGFRYFTEETASRYGLCGWVRNTAEGTVELEAQGDDGDIDAFLDALRAGPPLSYVTGIKSYEMPCMHNENGFTIG